MAFFESIRDTFEKNPVPIILIDISGSTHSQLGNGKTIREYEFDLAQKLYEQLKFNTAHIITWSDRALLFENQSVNDIENVIEKSKKISGGTYLMCGFNLIKETYFSENIVTDIIIITDGEICDDAINISTKLNTLCKYKINIKIIATETGSKNYLKSNCTVGNKFFQMIRNNSMSRFINRFSIYNELETEFVNLSNPNVPSEYVPFRDQMFKKLDLASFIQYISNIVENMIKMAKDKKMFESDLNEFKIEEDEEDEEDEEEDKEEDEEDDDEDDEDVVNTDDVLSKGDKLKFLKLVHELSLSVFHITKEKPYHYQISIIDLFSDMFKDLSIYSDIRKLLLDEVNNHISGKSTTFTDLRKNKQVDIENTKMLLMDNVNKAISGPNDLLHFYHTSFLIRHNSSAYIIRSTNDLVSNRMDKVTYNNSSISINNGQINIPILFNPDMNNKSSQTSFYQWLMINYARVLNTTISNEYLYYYFLADAYILLVLNNKLSLEYNKLYRSYVEIILNSQFGNDKSIISSIINSCKAYIPENVLSSVISYTGLKISPLTLFYAIISEFIVPYFNNNKMNDKKKIFVESLNTYCFEDISKDLKLSELENVNVSDSIKDILQEDYQIKVLDVNNKDVYIVKQHLFNGTKIVCGSRQVNDATDKCDICGSNVEVDIIKQCDLIENIFDNVKQFYFNTNKHIQLGELGGLNDILNEEINNNLITPEIFTVDYDSIELSNIMIVDPISSSKMRVKTNEEFCAIANSKFPFLQNLDMTNVALCGGFVRSILLKQQMKDFDFFFHGLDSDMYNERFQKLLTDLLTNLRKFDPLLKFGMFFKPMFNVFELICFEDPTSHINKDFTLENFDKYKFSNLRKFNQVLKKNDKFYFEDNDEKGIKMRYRMQFVLCKFNNIPSILNSFDMIPSKVAFNGTQIYFTEKSLTAYRYMINEISLNGGSDMFKHRLNKYFKYGFSIVFPKTDRDWDKPDFNNCYNYRNNHSKYNENEGPLTFKVRSKIGNIIYINHNSNVEKMLERNQELEKVAQEKGKALYISSLFCSFVAVLRYVKINDINYIFPQYSDADFDKGIKLPIVDGNFTFKTGSVPINFIEAYNTKYEGTEWYKTFYKSMLLTNY
jgi:hypothetical protein